MNAEAQNGEGRFAKIMACVSEMFSKLINSGDDVVMLKQRLHSSAAQTMELSATADELDRNTHDMVTMAGQTKSAAEAMTAASKAGRDVVEETLKGNLALAEHSKTASSLVYELKADSETISRSVAIIDQVANQTNLLSLNAAIEAAKAAEHGKGFAVVAEEVRTLAGKAASSSRKIRESIEVMQKKVSQTLIRFEEINKMAQGNEARSQNINNTFGQIHRQATEVEAMSIKLHSSMDEQSRAISETAKTVELVAGDLQYYRDTLEQELDPNFKSMIGSIAAMDKNIMEMGISDVDLLDAAILDHKRWVHRIQRLLAGKIHLESTAQLGDHHLCRLGKWYFGVDHPLIQANPALAGLFQQVDIPHARIHKVFVELIEAYNSGRNSQSLVTELTNLSTEIVAGLNQLKEGIIASKI